jgi:hypothetical protein
MRTAKFELRHASKDEITKLTDNNARATRSSEALAGSPQNSTQVL